MRTLLAALLVLAPSIAPPTAGAQPLVVLDAGHGGTDPGAVGCSLEEANVVLDVAQRLQVLLEADGVRIAMTRSDDTFVGLSERAAFANARSADAFVSVHSNANAGTPATGTETFVYPGAGARTRALGQGIQDAMIAAWMLRDRGLKEADFAVLRETSMPAALGELAFTNNCGTDAVLLADPAARQRLAEHERLAILEWLGIDPTMRDGTLRGIVFEDQGVGEEDTTVRLGGASVRIVETGASATAGADGAFSFPLPAGAYTIEASHAGHVMGSRACTVSSGMVVDCAIGLVAIASPVDASAGGEDASVVPGEVDAGPGGPGREPVSGCGCAVDRRGGAGWLVLALGLGIVLARRRRALAIALVLGGCAGGAARTEQPVTLRPIAITLGPEREWLAPGYADPVLSPDGSQVAIASEDHGALFVASLEGEPSFREVCRVGRCGWAPRWQGDRELAYRVAGQSGTAVPAEAIAIATMEHVAPVGSGGVHAWTDEDDRAFLREGGETREIGPEGARVIMPVVARDHVVMWDLRGEIVAHRISDRTIARLGRGGHPRVDPGGRWLVFERVEDDGHAITRGDLVLCDLEDLACAPLVTSADRIERTPTLSRIDDEGRGTLAYLAEGALVVRAIEVRR